jgi:hypothetical protein
MSDTRAAQVSRYRAEHPAYTARMSKRAKARNRALAALARRHPADFVELFGIELERLGVDDEQPRGRKPRAEE